MEIQEVNEVFREVNFELKETINFDAFNFKVSKAPQLTLGKIRDYILIHFPKLLWWDGFHQHETFNPSRSYKHRAGMPNEIRIEFDLEDRNKSFELINQTCINLDEFGYSYAVFYADGGRSPHIHIYDLDELETLNVQQREEYRREFLKKVCPAGSNPDMNLCEEKHLMALEFANHWKYNKPKELMNYFWNGRNQGIDFDIKINILFGDRPKPKIKEDQNKNQKLDFSGSNTAQQIMSVVYFEKVLDYYGIPYKNTMALCPFHADKDKSLSFSNEKKVWYCFGCKEKGDLITLVKKLEAKK